MRFINTSNQDRSDLHLRDNQVLRELALRIDDAFLSISDGILYPVNFTVWKNPGLSWKSEDEDGWTASDKVSVSLEVLTAAPTGVTVTPGDKKLDISWTAPAVPDGTTLTGYEVRYWRQYRWYEPIATGSTNTKYTLTGLPNGVWHTVQVRATHSKGHGAWVAFPPGASTKFDGFGGTPVGPN